MQGAEFQQSPWLISVLFAVLGPCDAQSPPSPLLRGGLLLNSSTLEQSLREQSGSWSPTTICQVELGILRCIIFKNNQPEDV